MEMKRSLVAACLGVSLAWAGTVMAQAPAAYPTPEQAQIAKTGKYVGSDACGQCHAAAARTQRISANPPSRLLLPSMA
jgi:mono/diheme cytochrome c family protein